MKATEWSRTRPRAPPVTSPASRSTDIPVMKDRYDGNNGNTQGDRKEKSPAENANRGPSDSLMRVLSQERLEQRLAVRSVPLAGAVGEEGAVAALVDDEGRGQGPHSVEPRHRHLGIEADREGELVLLEVRRHDSAVGILGDPQHHEPPVLESQVEAFHARHLLLAGLAPRRPEVEADDLAHERGRLELPAVRGGDVELLGNLDRIGLDEGQRRHGVLSAGQTREEQYAQEERRDHAT